MTLIGFSSDQEPHKKQNTNLTSFAFLCYILLLLLLYEITK